MGDDELLALLMERFDFDKADLVANREGRFSDRCYTNPAKGTQVHSIEPSSPNT